MQMRFWEICLILWRLVQTSLRRQSIPGNALNWKAVEMRPYANEFIMTSRFN